MYLLSDNTDTMIGMRLAGVEGKIVKNKDDIRSFTQNELPDDVAILLITKPVAELDRDYINSLREKKSPVIVEIPDREHCGEIDDSVTGYVREAMGIKL